MSEQVQVRFVTQTPYKVNDATILLPSSIKKEGLSEIVNGLLDIGKIMIIITLQQIHLSC